MEDLDLLCLGCMRKKPSGGTCPYCGFDEKNYAPPVYHLRPGTILNGEYLLGKKLGQGGFGITYIAWDLNLENRLAIKEYFPNGLVMRDVQNTNTVSIFTGKKGEYFEREKQKFLQEARVLGKFDGMEGVVSVKHFFTENKTAYIVMEYVDGEDLGEFLKRKGGKLPVDTVLEMMRPVIKVLEVVHSKGLLHRDISPDNLKITEEGKVKLLDFGAAREMSDGEKSLSVILKPGYAPQEQYRSKGRQGPWTDIYALCATIYRSITGMKPEDSLSRRKEEDPLKKPSELGIQIDSYREGVLMKGLAVQVEDRFQNMGELYRAFYQTTSSMLDEDGTVKIEEVQTGMDKSVISLLIIWGAIVIVIIVVIVMMMLALV